MFSPKLTAAKQLQGCSLVRRDVVVEVSVTYTRAPFSTRAKRVDCWNVLAKQERFGAAAYVVVGANGALVIA